MTEYLVLVAVFVVGVGFYGWFKTPSGSTLREFKAVPVKTIAELTPAEVRVRIVGIAREVGGQNVQAPQTGRICVVALYERWQVGTRYTPEHVVDRVDRKVPFAVEDATGSIVIDVATARMRLLMQVEEVSSSVFGAGILANAERGTYAKEGVVMPGDGVAVLGKVVRKEDGSLLLTSAVVTDFADVIKA